MRKFTKDGVIMGGNDFQANIFLKSGWVEVKDEPVKAEKVKPEAKAEKTEAKSDAEFSREEIEKLPFLKLKSVAKKNGIDVEEKDAKQIRAELIEKLGV